ncbi:DUF1396 domain-containing protein [Streptomyces sp. NPDC048566]|uniref:DUF1396 domain-containing protein n=1 Tax=Streptomyces sp. NPDC048566 TaxID=3365569 RepID=UPI003723A532
MRHVPHTSVRRGATTAVLATLVLGGGAVACSRGADESPEMTPAAAVAKAAKNTDEITSLRYRITGKVPEEGTVDGEAAMTMKPLAMSMKMTSSAADSDGPVEMRVVDGALYIGGGAAAAEEMDGKSWIKFDMSSAGAGKGMGADRLGGQADKNPAAESTLLTGSKNVRKVGTETVGGAKTTHYAGSVTLDDFRDTLKGEDKAVREQREKSLAAYEEMGVDTLTMDAWIDGDDRTKRFRMRGDADKGPLDMTVTFLDYNKPVTVKAPPAEDVTDLAAMMKELQEG